VDLSSAQTVGGVKTFTGALEMTDTVPLYFGNTDTGLESNLTNLGAGSLLLNGVNGATTSRGIWASGAVQFGGNAGATGLGTYYGNLQVNTDGTMIFSADSGAFLTLNSSTAAAPGTAALTNTVNGTSGYNAALSIVSTISQSSTAGYAGLFMNITETATGSGVKNLVDLQVGGISKFKVDDTGNLTMATPLTISEGGTGSSTQNFVDLSSTQTVGGAKTFTGAVTSNRLSFNNNAVTVTTNAGTCSNSFRLNTFTNSSAATMAITIATSGAVDGQQMIVRIYDFSAVAQTIGWTNTENSTVSVPIISNGSTTLPLTVGFIFNAATSLWRCVAVT
jgi:hypothetical protein